MTINEAKVTEIEQGVRGALSEGTEPQIEPEVRKINGHLFRLPPDHVVVPKVLLDLYEKSPNVVIDVLLRVADGARPTDSVTAATYALCLIDNPYIPVVVLEVFTVDTYDVINKHWKRTPRQHWIALIRDKVGKR